METANEIPTTGRVGRFIPPPTPPHPHPPGGILLQCEGYARFPSRIASRPVRLAHTLLAILVPVLPLLRVLPIRQPVRNDHEQRTYSIYTTDMRV